jgi:hypothetical protein
LVPRLHGFEQLEGASLFGENDLRALGPHKGLGIGVVALKIVVDGILELRNAAESATADALLRDLREEALDEVEPGRAGRREVKMETAMLEELALYRGRLVRPVVVEHETKSK